MALNTPINTETSGYSRSYRRRVRRSTTPTPPAPSENVQTEDLANIEIEGAGAVIQTEGT